MNAQAVVAIALKASIMLTLFGFGLQATQDDLLYVWRRPRLLVLSLVAMFVIMPLFVLLLTRVFHIDRVVVIVLLALSISPIPPLLPKKVTKSGGVTQYGLGLMATAGMFSIAYIPLASYILGKYFDRPFGISPGPVAKLIVLSVLVPLFAGMLFRKFAPAVAARIAQPIVRIAGIVLTIGALVILVVAFRTVWSFAKSGTVLGFITFVVVGLGVGHLLGGRDQDEKTTSALSTAVRHPGLALVIAGAYVSKENRVIGAVLLYALINALFTIPYIMWQKWRAKRLSIVE